MDQATLPQWADHLALSVPLICAPMGGAAGGLLARAVSRSGALGMIGMGSSGSRSRLEQELALIAKPTPRIGIGIGIGMVDWGVARDPGMLERAITARPALISVSFGEWANRTGPPEWIAAVRAEGITTATQVATADEARWASDAGVDLIVARGQEGGGHGDPQESLLPLLEAVLQATEQPVLAAGAISTGAELVRIMQAGAAGAWVGTAFAACSESLLSQAAKRALIEADSSDTLISRALDTVLGQPWPARFPERLVRNAFTDKWHGREAELSQDEAARATFQLLAQADDSLVPVNAGLGVGNLVRERPAHEVVADFQRAFDGYAGPEGR